MGKLPVTVNGKGAKAVAEKGKKKKNKRLSFSELKTQAKMKRAKQRRRRERHRRGRAIKINTHCSSDEDSSGDESSSESEEELEGVNTDLSGSLEKDIAAAAKTWTPPAPVLRNTDPRDTVAKVFKTRNEKSKVFGVRDFLLRKARIGAGRKFTVSVAIPGSIISNAQSPELRTYVGGQIGRCATIFNIDEMIIFGEPEDADEENVVGESAVDESKFDGAGRVTSNVDPNLFLVRLLQYLETPQYLRKALFPMHRDLKHAGILNPLDAPHHMRMEVYSPYREGVTLNKPVKSGEGSYVNVGLESEIRIDRKIRPGVRVTVQMPPAKEARKKNVIGEVVKPTDPRSKMGLFWGFNTRYAPTLSDVIAGCPFEGGYDHTIGTSERGRSVLKSDFTVPEAEHLLIVLGGVHGLEHSVKCDPRLASQIKDPSVLFDDYVNTCPDQGSRTIRTEEALLITMSSLQPHIIAMGALGGEE